MLFISFCFVKMSGELDWEEVQSLNCTFVQESQLVYQYVVVKDCLSDYLNICTQLRGVMKTTRLVKSLPASYKYKYKVITYRFRTNTVLKICGRCFDFRLSHHSHRAER